MAFDVYIQEKKGGKTFGWKKIQNGCQNGRQNQFFDDILLGTNLREKYQEYKNELQENASYVYIGLLLCCIVLALKVILCKKFA